MRERVSSRWCCCWEAFPSHVLIPCGVLVDALGVGLLLFAVEACVEGVWVLAFASASFPAGPGVPLLATLLLPCFYYATAALSVTGWFVQPKLGVVSLSSMVLATLCEFWATGWVPASRSLLAWITSSWPRLSTHRGSKASTKDAGRSTPTPQQLQHLQHAANTAEQGMYTIWAVCRQQHCNSVMLDEQLCGIAE